MNVEGVPHVVQIGFQVDTQRREPVQLLKDWPSLVDVAEATRAAGFRVSVVQACSSRGRVTRNGVEYYFFAADPAARTVAATWQFAPLIRSLKADVHHVHGLCFPQDVALLADVTPTVPILLQDHASRLPPLWRRRLWRRGLARAAGIAFCAREQSLPFAAAGLLGSQTEVYEIPESSSHFQPGSQQDARSRTGLSGDPCLLWVGHLNANKDPISVLEGIAGAVEHYPNLELWCCFGSAPLLGAVTRHIEQDSRLRGRVHLRGSVPHEQIELLMRAADFFVLGSHSEGSGYAVIEALACGLPPVVSDIPSFRSLTAGGTVGRLWPCDDPRALCEALRSIATQPRHELRLAVRRHFERDVSFGAIGTALASVYRSLIERQPSAVHSTTRATADNHG